MEDRQVIKVLSIDGGGIRGVICAVLLKELERRTGKSASSSFDVFIGTSTGGIMSLLLNKHSGGVPTHSIDDIIDFYTGTNGKTMFKKRFFKLPLDPIAYPSKQIEGVLKNLFLDSKLGESLNPTIVTTYDTISRNSIFLNSKDAGDSSSLFMWECARATSAAPTFFEPFSPFSLGNMVGIDGGIFANNPALFGYLEAKKLYPDADIIVISLGTGSSVSPISKKEIDKFNLLTWATSIFDFVTDGQSDTVDYTMARLHDVENYFRFQLKLDTKNASLDDVSDSNIKTLIEVSNKAIQGEWASEIDRLVELLK